MPKEKKQYLGNQFLDRKQMLGGFDKFPDVALSGDDRALQRKLAGVKRMRVMAELFQHFNINPKKEDAWMELSFCLAEHYVPAMKFTKKRGVKKKWDDEHLLLFFSFFHTLKRKMPGQSKKIVLLSMAKEAEGSVLGKMLNDLSYRTLEDLYDSFKKGIYGDLVEEIDELSDEDLSKFCKILEQELISKNP